MKAFGIRLIDASGFPGGVSRGGSVAYQTVRSLWNDDEVDCVTFQPDIYNLKPIHSLPAITGRIPKVSLLH